MFTLVFNLELSITNTREQDKFRGRKTRWLNNVKTLISEMYLGGVALHDVASVRLLRKDGKDKEFKWPAPHLHSMDHTRDGQFSKPDGVKKEVPVWLHIFSQICCHIFLPHPSVTPGENQKTPQLFAYFQVLQTSFRN